MQHDTQKVMGVSGNLMTVSFTGNEARRHVNNEMGQTVEEADMVC